MALKEYEVDGRTYLYDEDQAPKGAKLIGKVKKSVSPGDFESLVMAAHDAGREPVDPEVDEEAEAAAAAAKEAEEAAAAEAAKQAAAAENKGAPAPENK